ncbi:Endoglucanase [hydrothermal vent metagenome]|uniref:Endoglucanase n=1 Tax=hydrothermal vent metagenome TaxID=652676 RepID=A0A3B0TYC1_9ZZZZ
MKRILLLAYLLLPLLVWAQAPAFDFNKKLGRGINMGNMFDAPTENGWGNQWQEGYFEIIKNLGFSHVRIPIRWEPANRSMGEYPYTIYPTFFERIRYVVGDALDNGLYVIINMHHHEALYENPDGQKERFLSQWGQISEYFKDYPDSLVFEILNEPHGNLSPGKWNIFLNDALQVIRASNKGRFVLIGIAEYGGLGGLSKLALPDDPGLILTAHYYNPFHFTHQGAGWVGGHADEWLGTQWFNMVSERETIRNEFIPLVQFSEAHNIPVHIGEFGAYQAADMDSRVRWTNYLARFFDISNFSWAYWEFSAGFGIYDKDTQSIRRRLSDALLNDPMPEPVKTTSKELFSSAFNSYAPGWDMYTHQGASANLHNVGGELKVQIVNGSTEKWHVQLVKNNIRLEKGKVYELRFSARSPSARSITVYLGKGSSPWTAYSDYTSFYIEPGKEAHSMVIQMLSNTDYNSRIVFDIGSVDGSLYLDDISLNEVLVMAGTKELPANDFNIYPNPVSARLYFNNISGIKNITITNISGQVVRQIFPEKGTYYIDVSGLRNGIYLLRPEGGTSGIKKFCKIR